MTMEYTIKRPTSPCYLAQDEEPDGDWTDSLWSAWGGTMEQALAMAAGLVAAGEVASPEVVEIRRGRVPGELVEGATIKL